MSDEITALGQVLGRNIANRRKELALAQANLAERLGTDVVTISRFERGNNLPLLLRCQQIASVLKIPLAQLLSESSSQLSDQALQLEQYMANLDSKDRAFLIDMVKAWYGHLRDA